MNKINNEEFSNLLNEVFYNNITLEENIFITPLLAFGLFKKNVKNKLKNSNIAKQIKNFSNLPQEAKVKAMISTEKMRAATGVKSGKGKDASVYKLTDEQVDVMEDIYSKYGNKLIKEILDFRKNVLAPYSLIKRLVKQNKQLTSKETFGITKDEFVKALESGRKKIQNRGDKYKEKREDIQERINNLDEAKKHIEQIKKDFESGKRIDKNVLRKIYINYDLGENEFGDFLLSDLEKTYNELVRGQKEVEKRVEASDYSSSSAELIRRQAELRKGAVVKQDSGNDIDLTKNKSKFFDQGKFNDALGKYFLRREIVNELMNNPNSVYRKTYESIVDNMGKRLQDRRKKIFTDLLQLKKSTEFDSKEEKIWEPIKTSKDFFSNDLKDYKQKLKEDDFFNPEHFEKSDELVKAQRNIENEIKKFNRKVKSIVSDEDYNRLKKYRLINTIITVGELENKDKVFASPEEIKSLDTGEDKEEETISSDDFEKDLRYVATTEFDTVSELNNAKENLKKKYDKLDDEDKDKYKIPMKYINIRRDTEKKDASYLDTFLGSQDFDSDDIEKFVRGMLNKDYKSISEIKQDKETLDYMLSQYKKEDKDDYDKNIKEIEFLLKRMEGRLEDIESDLQYKD